MKHALGFLILPFIFVLVACETSTDNTIETARQCNDNAAKLALASTANAALAATQATACEAILTNANLAFPAGTVESLKIQFGAVLIEDQILPNIAQAATAKSQHTGNVDGLSGMLPLLIDPVATDAVKLQNIAVASGKSSLIYVSGLINMATTLANLGGGLSSGTGAGAVPADITACAGTPACAAALQTSFNSMSGAACASPVDNASTDPNNLCNKAKAISAAAGPNPSAAALANAIAAYAAAPH
jgi:hypothetical protein